MSAKDTYHHGDLRRALLDEALVLIGEKGVEHLSLREVAARVGVSHAAPYHHFADKTALIFALGQEGMQRLDDRMAAAERAAGDDAAARLLGIGTAYVLFAVENPEYFAAFTAPEMRAAQETPDGRDVTEALYSHEHQGDRAPGETWVRLLNAVLACQASGDLPPGDPVILGVYLWSLVHGLAELWRTGPLPLMPQAAQGPEPLVRQVLATALESIPTNARNTR